MALLEGVKVVIGGREFIIPPLNLKSLKKLGPKLKSLTNLGDGMPGEEQVDTIIEVIHAGLVRNYPNVTLEELEEMVDLGNMLEILPAVLAASGLKKKEGEASGEAKAP